MTEFGQLLFTDEVLENRVAGSVFNQWKKIKQGHEQLPLEIADIIACAMKDWAVEKGVTHYSHWFLPLAGTYAEKHETFLDWNDSHTHMLQSFSGKELVQSQPDASSFPNGGLRSTFEARGYTAWDIHSPAFLMGKPGRYTLTIPTVFISFTGQALDKKTPLLRSIEALNLHGTRLLNLLGFDDVTSICSNLGPEQEYFLVDEEHYKKRPDLQTCGRTILGSRSYKGQELGDHYCGVLNERVKDFMSEVNQELWALGVPAKTQHNEVAPQQYELAILYGDASQAVTWNALAMGCLQSVARHHKFVCILKEKPFKNLNGSGKHINWSLVTNTGVLLFKNSTDPKKAELFMIMVAAVMYAIDTYAELLRASVASFDNDFRLGGQEAPPAIMSVFLGKELCALLKLFSEGKDISEGINSFLSVGSGLPDLEKDESDRNRTSPFGFSVNKFEFRMPGSSINPSWPSAILHAAIAEAFSKFADKLEKESLAPQQLFSEFFKKHERILFNGDGYTEAWVYEAKKRGLPVLSNSVEAYQKLDLAKNKQLLSSLNILDENEFMAHKNIYVEAYVKEATLTAQMLESMVSRGIIPQLIKESNGWNALGNILGESGKHLSNNLQKAGKDILTCHSQLRKVLEDVDKNESQEIGAQAYFLCYTVLPLCETLRMHCDNLEAMSDARTWPYPSYDEMLFTVL